MKMADVVPKSVLFLFLLVCLSTRASADCGEQENEELPKVCCGGAYEMPDVNCASGGNPSTFCIEGWGSCCGESYNTANEYPNDPSCHVCNPSGSPPYGQGQCYSWSYTSCSWVPTTCQPSPIILDTTGHSFKLTSATGGVVFDISGTGKPIRIAWTATESGNAFLALDRNQNGKIDGGNELFGNFTPQPPSSEPNGFLALAEFDKPQNGGNGDGIIDRRDAVFAHLLLWIDENHDGISQSDELHSLPELGISSLSLKYRESRRTDEFGNQFRFRAKVNPRNREDDSGTGRLAYDVFFVSGDTQANARPIRQSRNHCDKKPSSRPLLDDSLGFPGSTGHSLTEQRGFGGIR